MQGQDIRTSSLLAWLLVLLEDPCPPMAAALRTPQGLPHPPHPPLPPLPQQRWVQLPGRALPTPPPVQALGPSLGHGSVPAAPPTPAA